jgi:hypothetical protein
VFDNDQEAIRDKGTDTASQLGRRICPLSRYFTGIYMSNSPLSIKRPSYNSSWGL